MVLAGGKSKVTVGFAAVCLLLALFVLALTPGPAAARSFSTSSSFGFFSGTPDAFLGEISSNNKPKCRKGRLVKVFRERGRRDTFIGRDRASSTGQWIVEKTVPSGRYYALIPKKRFGPNGRNNCRRYKSTTLRFES
jgi:hypothetical protein